MDRKQLPCYYLRTKAFYVSKTYGLPFLEENRLTEHYWCVKTMGATGPDDMPVQPGECLTSRPCYQPRTLEV